MLKLTIIITKGLLVILWALAILLLVSLSPLSIEFNFYVLALASTVLIIHLIEYFAIKAKIIAKTKIKMSFVQTMLWGFGYWLPLLNKK